MRGRRRMHFGFFGRFTIDVGGTISQYLPQTRSTWVENPELPKFQVGSKWLELITFFFRYYWVAEPKPWVLSIYICLRYNLLIVMPCYNNESILLSLYIYIIIIYIYIYVCVIDEMLWNYLTEHWCHIIYVNIYIYI